ncbi:glycosyltransferase family 2 protein [Alicyclobacillus acidiphilus]|uniref:glycosyltransferase family 2 protein n=1 Tax=Alicyclobacillus acidiphilus TaxID=182455 RepID=UPI000832D06B|nr:glycosyltransferase family 2 protein [Alicyclobacillus acidiphilus]
MFERVPNLVSIVVPVYNNAVYLPACLDSLVNQTYRNIEIVIVDDHSTDDCAEVVSRWQSEVAHRLPPERIIFVSLPVNVKQPGSATVGLFLAQGEFIACQAADDLSHPERIQRQVEYLRKHSDVEMVGTNYATFEDGDLEHASLDYSVWIKYGREQIRQSYGLGEHCVCDGTILMRGAAFDRMGGWTRRMTSASDFEFVGRYVSGGVVTENLPDVLYYYRLHPGQTTQRLARGESW